MSDDNRPIEVGDYVRWEYGPGGPFTSPANWAEGEVARIDRFHVDICVACCGLGKRTGTVTTFGIGPGIGPGITSILRRIPPPAEAQATATLKVRSKRWVHCLHVSDSGIQCRASTEDPSVKIGWMCPDHVPVPQPAPPAPALVHGLTREQCLERWLVNRSEREYPSGCKRPVYDLTQAQIVVGRHAYRTAAREEWSAELRAKVTAAREAERNLVTYCEVEPWE